MTQSALIHHTNDASFVYQHSTYIADALQNMHIFNTEGTAFADWQQLVTSDLLGAPKLGLFWNVPRQVLCAAPIETKTPLLVWVPFDCFLTGAGKQLHKHIRLRLMQMSIRVRQGNLPPVLDGLMGAQRHLLTKQGHAGHTLGPQEGV